MANENNNINTAQQPTPGPSTPDNQISTPEPKVDKVPPTPEKAPIPTPGRKIAIGEVKGESVKQMEAIEKHKKEAEKREQAAIAQKEQDEKKALELQGRIDKLRADVQYAKDNNLESGSLQARLQNLESEQTALITKKEKLTPKPPQPIMEDVETREDKLKAEQLATQDYVDKAMQPESQPVQKQEIDNIVRDIKTQRVVNVANKLAMQDEIDKQRAVVEKSMERLKGEDLRLNKIDPNRFWNGKKGWSKVRLTLGLLFGGRGAIQAVQNAVERDIDAQKLDNKSKLAHREEAYRRINAEINRLEGMTRDSFKLEQLKLAKQKMVAEQIKANEARMRQAQRDSMRDYITQNNVKLEDLSPSMINSIFTKEDFKQAQNLRGEFNAQTQKLGTREVLNAFGDIQALSNYVANGPTDIYLLTKAMKFIDPNSVVREGEFHIAETASPPIKAVVRIAQKFAKGTRLTDGDRKAFAQNAVLLLKVKLKNQEKIAQRYRSLSQQHGIPSSMVVEDFKLKDISKKEAMWEKQKAKNPKAKRDVFERSWNVLTQKYPNLNN